MDELYEYNGKQYTLAQLQEKYGEKANDAITKFGMKKVEQEPTYTYKDKTFTRSQLQEKYGDKTDEAIQKFGFQSDVKKKENSEPTFTAKELDSASQDAQSGGSLATQENKYADRLKFVERAEQREQNAETQPTQQIKDNPTTTPPKGLQTATPQQYENEELRQLNEDVSERTTGFSSIANFDNATQLTAEDISTAEQKASEKLEGTKMEGFTQGLTKAGNVFSQFLSFGLAKNTPTPKTYRQEQEAAAVKYLKENKLPETPESIAETSKMLAVQKETKALKEQKITEYVEQLPEEEKKRLEIDKVYEYKTLEMGEKAKVMEMQIDIKKLEETQSKLKANEQLIKQYEKEGKEIPENLANLYNEKVDILNGLREKYEGFAEEIKSNEDKRIESQEALDLIKRNYGFLDNIGNVAREGFIRAYGGAIGAAGYIENIKGEVLGDPIAKMNAERFAAQSQEVFDTVEIVNEDYQKRMTYDQINDWTDVGYFMAQETVAQTATITQLTATGGVGIYAIGVQTGGEKFARMKAEEKNAFFPKNYNLFQEITAPVLYGTAEAYLGAAPTLGILKRAASTEARGLLAKGFTSHLKDFGKDLGIEVSTEMATTLAHNSVDRFLLGDKSVSLSKDLDHTAFQTLASMPMIILGGKASAQAIKPFIPKTQTEAIRKNLEQIEKLRGAYENAQDPEVMDMILGKIEALNKDNETTLAESKKDLSNIDKARYEKVRDISQQQAEMQMQADKIVKDKGLEKQQKKEMLDGMSKEYDGLNEQRNRINEGKPNLDDLLSEKEVFKLKERAAKELQAEYSENENYEITEAEITKKAQEIYNAEKTETTQETKQTKEPEVLPRENEAESVKEEIKPIEDEVSPTVELSPESTNVVDEKVESAPVEEVKVNEAKPTESKEEVVEQPTEKKLNETQAKQNTLVDTKNQYNKLSASKKRSAEGQGLKQNVIQLSSDLGFKVSEKGSKLSVKNDKGKEAGKIAFKENIAESTPEDINHAVNEIDKGILRWDGNPMSPRVDLGLSRADVRKGEADLKAGKTNTVPAKRLTQALKEAKANGTYEYIEGSGGQINRINVPLTQRLDAETELTVQELEEINQNEEQLSNEYDNWLNSLDENTLNEIYENETGESGLAEEQPTQEREGQENVSDKKETKSKEERKQIAFDKIDDLAQKLKDALPGIKDSDLNVNGFTQDQLIDLMAKSVKHLVSTGIDVNDAIKQVVQSIKDKLNVDINPDDVRSKITTETPQKEPKNDFERKSGQKSLLTRAATGGANEKIKTALKKHGLDYEVQNQDEAKKRAEAFVKDVGLDEAIAALKSGVIAPGAELAFIYGTVIDAMETQSETATGKQKEKIEQDYAKLQEEIFTSFDVQAREFGRFLSALNKVYNSSHFRYNLTKQIEAHKARHNGEIDAETLKRFEERDARIKEFEKQIKELEEKLEKAEAQQAIDNIQEANGRQKPKVKPSKSSLKTAATALRKVKFTQTISDLSKLQSDPTGIIKGIWDGAIEVVATALDKGATIEAAVKKGIAHIKKSDWYKNLKPESKKVVSEKFNNDVESFINNEATDDNLQVSIDEDGKITVPAKLIRQLVSEGITDIDELSQKILDEYLADEDVTLREVRDAITGYGKTINPTKDELSEQISKMKNLGRILSGSEDVEVGQRPKRSGLQRRKKTDEERRKEGALREAMRDLPLDEGDLERQWKTQLDAIKSRLTNQIKDLQDQIEKRERRKPERQPIERDQAAKDLEAERDALKETLDNLVGKPELSYEQKVKMAESALEKSIDKLEADIKLNKLAFKESTTLTSNKLKTLRAKQKQLKEQLNEMREASGLIEKRRLEGRKKAVQKRLEELQEKRRSKDYSKKERKPLAEDKELADLQRKYNREKEKYDQEAYADELRNMHPLKKAANFMVNLFGLQRVLLATGELSTVFLQNGVPTVNMLVRNPIKLANIAVKTLKSYSKSNFERDQAELESREYYDLALKNKVAFTKENFRLAAKEETFQSDLVSATFKFLGEGMDFDGSSKLTLYDTVLKKLGVDVKNKERFSVSEQVQNVNPFAVIERFTTTYSNHIRMELFAKGAKMLEAENKNPIDHKEDYKRLAKAVNTLTGRASLGRFDAVSPELNMLFFSVRFATSTFNKLNPYWYGVVLRNQDNALKPSVAQKLAISQAVTYIATTTAFILAVQALGGDDEDGEKVVTIESDPTSSDFAKMKIGNIRYDPWGGHLPWVTLFSRMVSGKMKKSNGKTVTLGQGNNDTKFEKIVDFTVGKLNPTLATSVRFLNSTEEIDGVKRDEYGNEVSVEEEIKMMYPIYWQGIKEVMEEDPEKGKELAYALTALGLVGVNNQVYGQGEEALFQSYSKDIKNELSINKNQLLRPNKKEVTSDEKLEEDFSKFKDMHEKNYKDLYQNVKKMLRDHSEKEVKEMLSDAGHSKKDIRKIMIGRIPEMIEIKKSTKDYRIQIITSRLSKGEKVNEEEIIQDINNKAKYYNNARKKYNNSIRGKLIDDLLSDIE